MQTLAIAEDSNADLREKDFEKQLVLVTLPAQASLKGKEKEIPPEVADQASKPKLQIKLKP